MPAEAFDAIVLGTGPAGLAALHGLAERGLSAAAVSPAPHAPWTSCYGLWLDEARGLGIEDALAERWEHVEIRLDERRHFFVGRTYARVDNATLQARFVGGATRAGVRLLTARARRVRPRNGHLEVELDDGARLAAWAVLDARGPAALNAHRRGPLAQVAWGVELQPSSAEGTRLNTARLMDFSVGPLAERTTPTFLYALPLADGALLLEETSLARAPPADLATLRAGLERRLAHLDIAGEIRRVERVFIPMTPRMPPDDGGPIRLGAAAALVNPLSGYLLPAALRHADEMAALLAEARAAGASFEDASRAAFAQTWTLERRLSRALRRFGIDVLARLDLERTRDFFEALFTSSPDGWRALLSHDAPPDTLVRAMSATFRALPASLRVRAALGLSRHLDLLVHLPRGGGFSTTRSPRRSHVGRAAKPHA